MWTSSLAFFKDGDCKFHLVTFRAPTFKNTSFSQNTSSGCFCKKHSGNSSPDFSSGNCVVKEWMVPNWKIALIRKIILLFNFNQILHFSECFWSSKSFREVIIGNEKCGNKECEFVKFPISNYGYYYYYYYYHFL